MEASVCLTSQSFDFNAENGEILGALHECGLLIEKMNSSFVTFLTSDDFYNDAWLAICSNNDLSSETGALVNMLYDGEMSKAHEISLSSTDITAIADTELPVFENCLAAVYSSNEDVLLTPHFPKHTIHLESCLVGFCTKVISENPRPHSDYGTIFKTVYSNLVFLDYADHKEFQTFNHLNDMTIGYDRFLGGITTCLDFFNSYTVQRGDPSNNIDVLNSSLEFPVTPEGKGKGLRKPKELKRDFLVDGVEYKNINCEYHYKLEYVDGANGKGKYCFNRIYFGFLTLKDTERSLIAISHIGFHL